MLSLSPAKLLVVLVVALIVLGPEKLPQVARQVGSLWGDLRKWRARIESEVRSTFPDLPPAHEVAQAVRSPLSFLDRLADAHESAGSNGDGPASATGDALATGDEAAGDAATGDEAAGDETVGTEGVRASPGVEMDAALPGERSSTNGAGDDPGDRGAEPSPAGPVHEAPRSRPFSLPSASDVDTSDWGYDDPSMN